MGEMVARPAQRKGKEGNRWVNERPSGEDLSKWFADTVKVQGDLDHSDYVAGVTLIPGKEKIAEVVGWDQTNSPILADFYDLVLTPYMRVETRLKYFHDLMAAEDIEGYIEPVVPETLDPHLPLGFFRFAIATKPGFERRYIGCAMKVTVYQKNSVEMVKVILDKRTGREGLVRRGRVLIDAPPATKLVPTVAYDNADDHVVSKAETGAIGRALGMAGILVIPGTGIATAEDMQEVRQQASTGAEAAELPSDLAAPEPEAVQPEAQAQAEATDEELRVQAKAIIDEMAATHPDAFAEFKSWAAERGHQRLSEVTSPALRGLVRKAENMLTDAKSVPPEPSPAPAAEPSVKPASKDPLED